MFDTQFTNIQLDALKEVSNVGTGNAATALSMILGKKVDMTVPHVQIIKMEELFKGSEETLVVGVVVRAIGDIPGNILIIFQENVAKEIVGMLTSGMSYDINEMGTSALCEIGNILSSTYMNAISQFTGLSISASVPALSYDMLSAILTTTFVEAGQHEEYILNIETLFHEEEGNEIGASFYYIPAPGSIEKILKSIGMN